MFYHKEMINVLQDFTNYIELNIVQSIYIEVPYYIP